MPALFFVPLALPLACLAGVSLFGFLVVFAIAGALQVVALTSSSAERSSGLEQHGRSFLVRAAECRQKNRRGLLAF